MYTGRTRSPPSGVITTWFTSKSMTRYGSHQHCARWTLSRFPRLLCASRCCVTLDGETACATLACCDASAACTAAGTAIVFGSASPSAYITLRARARGSAPGAVGRTEGGRAGR